MATTKVTFTLDNSTVALLEDAAHRLAKPKSGVVRDAIAEYHERIDRLTDSERSRMLWAIRELAPKIPVRSQAEIDAELKEIRRARRAGWRKRGSVAGA